MFFDVLLINTSQEIVMRIGVNLLPLVPCVVGGIKQYFAGLFDELLEVDQDVSYVYYTDCNLRRFFCRR